MALHKYNDKHADNFKCMNSRHTLAVIKTNKLSTSTRPFCTPSQRPLYASTCHCRSKMTFVPPSLPPSPEVPPRPFLFVINTSVPGCSISMLTTTATALPLSALIFPKNAHGDKRQRRKLHIARCVPLFQAYQPLC